MELIEHAGWQVPELQSPVLQLAPSSRLDQEVLEMDGRQLRQSTEGSGVSAGTNTEPIRHPEPQRPDWQKPPSQSVLSARMVQFEVEFDGWQL